MTSNSTGELALRIARAADSELDDLVTSGLRSAAIAAGVGRAYVTAWSPDGETFRVTHEWTNVTTVPHAPAIDRIALSDFPYSTSLAHRGTGWIVEDVGALPDEAASERESFLAFGVHAVVQVPIAVGDVAVGVIGLNDLARPRAWDPRIIDALDETGAAISIAFTRREAERRMAEARNRQLRAETQASDLLAGLGHELRTPLHAILGYAELLEHEQITPAAEDAAVQITRSGQHLLTLIEGLLTYSQDAGTARGPESLADLAGDVISVLEPVAEHRSISLQLEAAAPSPVADPVAVRRALHCVLSGAVTAVSAGGTVEIDVRGGTVLVTLPSTTASERTDALVPLARALLGERGRIDLTASAGTSRVRVELDQPESP